ncbi:MAG: hypothetical protein U5N53_22700 [Mycobacterium sp.]|nr:hypothetical protein [Mycobacterium sp.]
MYTTLHSLFRKLPPSWRAGMKQVVGTQGHGHSTFDWLSARKDATGKKRLDHALEGVIQTIGHDEIGELPGKVCVDFGAGYVPTDGVAMWLLGAREVHGIDYNRIAKPKEVARAITSVHASSVHQILQGLQIDSQWKDRLDNLTTWAQEGAGGFPPGYIYVAPADIIESPTLLPKFDILLSTSVLEHIRPSQMAALLDVLKARENSRATQIHRVDLRDHRDFLNNPYGFLDPSDGFDCESDADARGNGMTLRDWEMLLAGRPEWNLGVNSYELGRPDLIPLSSATQGPQVIADTVLLRTIASADRTLGGSNQR